MFGDKHKRKFKFSKITLIGSYFVIWVISIIIFWFVMDETDALAYSIAIMGILIPATTFTVSLAIGITDYWGKWKWFSAVVFGIMYMLLEYFTFSIANTLAFDKVNIPEFSLILIGGIISAIGLAVGSAIRKFKC